MDAKETPEISTQLQFEQMTVKGTSSTWSAGPVLTIIFLLFWNTEEKKEILSSVVFSNLLRLYLLCYLNYGILQILYVHSLGTYKYL